MNKVELVEAVAEAVVKTQYLGKFADTKDADLAQAAAAVANPEACDLAALIATARARQASFTGEVRREVEAIEQSARRAPRTRTIDANTATQIKMGVLEDFDR